MNKKAYYIEKGLLIVALLFAIINGFLHWFDYQGNYMPTYIVLLFIFLAVSIHYLFQKK